MRQRVLALLLCGILTGGLFFFVTQITLGLLAKPFLEAIATAPRYAKLPTLSFLIIDLLMGVWVVWLYARLSANRRGVATAMIVGSAWWAMKSLQSGNWVSLGFIPHHVVLLPLLTSFVSCLTAALVGGRVYDMVTMTALSPRQSLAGSPEEAQAAETPSAPEVSVPL